MEVNTTCGLRGSMCCDDGSSYNIIIYLMTMVWIAVFIIGVKVKKD